MSPSSQAIIQNTQRLDQRWSPHWTLIFSLSRILEHKLTWHNICNGNHWLPQWMLDVMLHEVGTHVRRFLHRLLLLWRCLGFFFLTGMERSSSWEDSKKTIWKVEMLHRLDAETLRWGALLHLSQLHAQGQRAHWSHPQFSLESNTAYCSLTSETPTRRKLVMWVMFYP